MVYPWKTSKKKKKKDRSQNLDKSIMSIILILLLSTVNKVRRSGPGQDAGNRYNLGDPKLHRIVLPTSHPRVFV